MPDPVGNANPILDCRDRLNLAELRKRFLHINNERLRRTRVALSQRQVVFLDALPLLFHCNHPMLPGFVSHATPAGLCGYKPDKEELAKGKALARSFCMSSGHNSENIWGIYLMGSTGTLAQSSASDFDVWLCHKPGLSKPALQELVEKCKRIERWAEDRGVEAHFFVMDSDAFKRGQTLSLDDESSGSAQRFLLLDEFYRTGLYVGGRLPIWWFCSTEEERNYNEFASELVDKRFVRPDTILDFGGLSEIPPGEFVGAGIWQLYKAISSPYKSVLKLLLMEAYVCDYPNIRALALDYKQLIYAEPPHIDDIDPYLMVYRRIENYLTQIGDQERLELARRCFYFKIHKPLSKAPTNRRQSWQRIKLQELVDEWAWSSAYIAHLDQRSEWKTLQVKQERALLVQALNTSYEFLQRFAKDTDAERSISTNELNVLGRKLQAAFERRPDKLEWENPGISKDISEQTLSLVATQNQQEEHQYNSSWQLFGSETGRQTALRQSSSPVELLLWSYFNGVVDEHSRFDLSRADSLNENQVKRCLNRIKRWLPLPLPNPDQSTFMRAAAPARVFMVINFGFEPESFIDPTGMQRLSDNTDPLSYGGMEENQVASLDMLTINSWNEITSQHFQGSSALINALKSYMDLCMPGSYQAPPELTIECLGQHNTSSIGQRAQTWFQQIIRCYYSGTKPASTRYLFQLSGHYHSLQFRGPKLLVQEHDSEQQLLRYLGESQSRYSPLALDERSFKSHPLKLIAQVASARAVHVFFRVHQYDLFIYVVDERGSFMQMRLSASRELPALNALHYFLRNTLKRQAGYKSNDSNKEVAPLAVEFHEIKRDSSKLPVLTHRKVTPELKNSGALNVSAKVCANESGHFEYNFYCVDQKFEWKTLGQDVFYSCASFVLAQRKEPQLYPVHISDLDLEQCRQVLSRSNNLQTAHYLRIKVELERKLTKAIRALS